MSDASEHDDIGPTLKIRIAFDPDTNYRNIGVSCQDIAREIIALANQRLVKPGPGGRPHMTVIDATWASPEGEWRERGGGW